MRTILWCDSHQASVDADAFYCVANQWQRVRCSVSRRTLSKPIQTQTRDNPEVWQKVLDVILQTRFDYGLEHTSHLWWLKRADELYDQLENQ
jgi:hypothetical protein